MKVNCWKKIAVYFFVGVLVGVAALGVLALQPQKAHGYTYAHTNTTSIFNRAWIQANPSGYLELIGSDPNGPRPYLPSWDIPSGTPAWVVSYQFALWSDAGGQDDLAWYTAGSGSWSRGGANMGTGDLSENANGAGFGCIATYGYGWGGSVIGQHGGFDALLHNHVYLHSKIEGMNDDGRWLHYASVDFWPRVKIQYDANGGTEAPDSHLKYIGTTANVSKQVPTRTGYTFEGWSTNRAGPVNIAPGQAIGYQDWNLQVESDISHWWDDGPAGFWRDAAAGQASPSGSNTITLYAQWKPISYTIEYDGNGATRGSMEPSPYVYDAAKPLSANGFERSYTLTCDAQGGSAGSMSLACVWPWASWNTQVDGAGVSYGNNAVVKNIRTTSGTVVLFAQWEPGSVSLPDPGTKPGCTFEGWYTAPSGGNLVGAVGSVVSLAADATYYARWQELAEVRYFADGEYLSGYTDLLPVGEAYQTRSDATAAAAKQNCAGFEGWFTDAACTRRYQEDTPVPAEGLHLYGRNKVTLSYALTDRSVALFADRVLYADQALTEVRALDALVPQQQTLYYGDRAVFERGSTAWFESHDRPREATCEAGAYATAAAEGPLVRVVRLTNNTVVYLNWHVPAYDGIAVS